MADNLRYNEPVSGPTLATDDVGGVHYPITKLDGGGNGASAPILGDSANGMDVDVTRLPATVSANNSTTATLTANSTFTGTGEEVKDYAAVTLNIRASHVSATDGVSVEWSNDNSNWDRTEKFTYRTADQGFTVTLRPKGRYYRIVYTNGGTGQTAFRLQSLFHAIAPYREGYPESGRVLVDGVSYPVKWIKINATASGDNTIISLVSGKRLRVVGIAFTCSASVDIAFKSGTNTLIDAMSFAKQGGLADNGQPAGYWLETNAGEAFVMNLSASVNVRGRCYYAEVP